MSSLGSSISGPSVAVSSVAGGVQLQSPLRSKGTRRGPLSHPAILFLIAVAIFSATYALGYLPQLGSLVEAGIRSGQSRPFPALGPAFYGIAGLVAFLLLLALLRSLDMLLVRIGKTSFRANRTVKPLADFLKEAAAAKISLRVARESYHLLQPHYPHVMDIDLTDRLRDDLRLDEKQIRALGANLLKRCGRRHRPSEDAEPNVSKLTNVLDLLVRVEAAVPVCFESVSNARARSTDLPGPVLAQADLGQTLPAQNLRAQQSRNPTSAQRKAIHAAALHAIESRTLRIAETSGMHRRSSDYEGPRRRATDDLCKLSAYLGPYRRSTDQMAARTGTSCSEPLITPDPADLDRLGTVLVPPRNRRSAEPSGRS